MTYGDRIYKYAKDGHGTWWFYSAILVHGIQSTWSARYDDGTKDPLWSLEGWATTKEEALRDKTQPLQDEINKITRARNIV